MASRHHSEAADANRAAGPLVPLLVLVASFTIALPIHLRGLVLLDEGALLHLSQRIADGEVLYRDLATGIMPGAYYFYALLLKLFGSSVELGRFVEMILLAASTTLVYLLGREYARPRVALIAAGLYFTIAAFPYRYPNYSPLAILLVLVGVLLFLRFVRTQSTALLVLSSFALSLSFLTKQNYGLMVFVALGSILALDVWIHRPGSARRCLLYATAFLAPVLTVVICLIALGAFEPFIEYTISSLFGETLSSFYKPYPLLDLGDPVHFTRDYFSYTPFPPLINFFEERPRWLLNPMILLIYLLPLLVLVTGAGSLVADVRRQRVNRGELALYAASLALFAGVYPRSDYHHLALVLPLVIVLASQLYARFAIRVRRASLLAAPVLGLVTILGLGSIVPPYLPIFLELPERQSIRMGIARARNLWVTEREADLVRGLVHYVERHVPEDAPLLIIPNDPLLYFLTGRRNPSPYPLALPGSFDEDRLLDILPLVDHVLYRDTTYDATPVVEVFPRLASYLRQSYIVDANYLATVKLPMRHHAMVLKRGSTLREAAGPLLIEPLLRADRRIVTLEGKTVEPRGEEIPRVLAAPWLLEPALQLRPPSGWQKLVLSCRLSLPAEAELRFSLALRPIGPKDPPDGAGLDIFLYDVEAGRATALFHTWLEPQNPDYWRFRSHVVGFPKLGGQEVILAFAAWSGAGLDERGDQVVIGEPRIVASGQEWHGSVLTPGVPSRFLQAIGRFEEPESFERALRYQPRDAQIHLHLGQVLAGQGRDSEALTSLSRAATLDPQNAEIQLALAEFHLAQGRAQGARDAYEKLLELDPANVRAMSRLAELVLAQDGDARRSYRLCQKARRRASRNPEVLLTLGRLLFALGRVEEGLEVVTDALQSAPLETEGLDLMNRHHPAERLEVAGTVLSRAQDPLPEAALHALIELRERPPTSAATGRTLSLAVEVTNPTTHPWPALGRSDGSYRIALGHRWVEATQGHPVAEGRTLLPHDLEPGQTVELRPRLPIPDRPGLYRLRLDLLQERVTWFAERGTRPIEFEVNVY